METNLNKKCKEYGVLLNTSYSDILPVLDLNRNAQKVYNKFVYNLTLDIVKCDDVSDDNIKRMCDESVENHKELNMDQACLYKEIKELLTKLNTKFSEDGLLKEANECIRHTEKEYLKKSDCDNSCIKYINNKTTYNNDCISDVLQGGTNLSANLFEMHKFNMSEQKVFEDSLEEKCAAPLRQKTIANCKNSNIAGIHTVSNYTNKGNPIKLDYHNCFKCTEIAIPIKKDYHNNCLSEYVRYHNTNLNQQISRNYQDNKCQNNIINDVQCSNKTDEKLISSKALCNSTIVSNEKNCSKSSDIKCPIKSNYNKCSSKNVPKLDKGTQFMGICKSIVYAKNRINTDKHSCKYAAKPIEEKCAGSVQRQKDLLNIIHNVSEINKSKQNTTHPQGSNSNSTKNNSFIITSTEGSNLLKNKRKDNLLNSLVDNCNYIKNLRETRYDSDLFDFHLNMLSNSLKKGSNQPDINIDSVNDINSNSVLTIDDINNSGKSSDSLPITESDDLNSLNQVNKLRKDLKDISKKLNEITEKFTNLEDHATSIRNKNIFHQLNTSIDTNNNNNNNNNKKNTVSNNEYNENENNINDKDNQNTNENINENENTNINEDSINSNEDSINNRNGEINNDNNSDHNFNNFYNNDHINNLNNNENDINKNDLIVIKPITPDKHAKISLNFKTKDSLTSLVKIKRPSIDKSTLKNDLYRLNGHEESNQHSPENTSLLSDGKVIDDLNTINDDINDEQALYDIGQKSKTYNNYELEDDDDDSIQCCVRIKKKKRSNERAINIGKIKRK